ncbi:MAG: TetR/AcrR family transcriptional regulator [Acidobacteriia bacterium]|nr:TetR/AcrR family transcriptional regulator [Terriglobia bacterium]
MKGRKNDRRSRPTPGENGDTRFDRRLGEILEHATEVFYTKGYEGASMRDLSRTSGMSLAGLYYYFESKEKLLYLIQKHTFSTITGQLQERLRDVSDPEERVRVFIRNHLEYFLANLKAMKLLSHEDEALTGPLGTEIAAMKRDYYRLIRGMVEELRRTKAKEFSGDISSRAAALSLFGMMNWIYTWHNPGRDPSARELANMMADIFLRGLLGQAHPASPPRYASGQAPAGETRVGQPSSKPGSVGSAAGQKSSGRASRSASSNI